MGKYIPPFTITNEMLFLISSIMEKIGKIDSYDNLIKYPVLRKQNRIKSIHSSCAIEANSLSFEQVIDIINGVKVIGPKKDIIEIQNAMNAYKKIEDINPLSEVDLRFIHSIFEKDVNTSPGDYRNGNEGVFDENGNAIFIAPPSKIVPSLMSNLFNWIKIEFKTISPLILSSIFHYEFVFIHPFTDGNGRLARYWQTALLGKWRPIFYWIPIENQIKKYQSEYYKAISESHKNGDSNVFIVFMLRMVESSLNELLNEAKQIDLSKSIYINKLLKTLKPNIWYSSNEILLLLNLKSKETLRKNYLNPAIESGLVIVEYKDKPTTKNQRYKIVKNYFK